MSTTQPLSELSTHETPLQRVTLRVIACFLLTLSICLLAFVTTNNVVANHDYVSYWAAGRQLLHKANPYAAQEIFAIERSVGWRAPVVMIMRNPPWGLFLTLPLGVLSLRGGYLFWLLLILGAWFGSVRMLWIMNGRSDNSVHLIAFAFAPAIACFVLGQTSIFVLFGLTSFLYFHQTKPYLAGAALALCALKPHLFLPFWVALFAWAITRKAYELAATAASTLVVCAAIPMVFDHSIYSQYSMMARSSGVKTELIPTLSEFLRIVVAPNSLWLQFLPAFAGCIWASWYFQRHSREWDWYRDGSLVILIAFVVAPYAWYFDAAVVLPSLLYAAYRARPRALAVLLLLLISAAVQMLLTKKPSSAWNLWPGVAWPVWFIYSMRSARASVQLAK